MQRTQVRDSDPGVFRLVTEAVLAARQLRFLYRARSTGRASARLVSPQRLIHHRDHWYLDAWDRARKALRRFALDRMSEPQLTGELSIDLPAEELDAHQEAGYGIVAGPDVAIAVIRFSEHAARWAIPVEEQVEPPPAPPQIKYLDTRNMVYDGLNRMTQANAPYIFGNETYVYDPLDNVRSSSFGSVTHTFSYVAGTNRLDRIDSDAPQPFSIAYDYNDQGDTTLRQITTPSGGPIFANGFENSPAAPPGPDSLWVENLVSTQTLQYDRAHRLTGVTGLESYVYDAHGHRVDIIRAGDGNHRYQIYSRDGRFLYTDDNGEIVNYIHLDGELVAERRPPIGGLPLIVRYYHTDTRGSPVIQSNSAGTQLRRTIYEPYGTTRDGQYINGPGFTGHTTDAGTGLTYMQQRYYDPIAYRFLSVDPVGAGIDSISRYWYASANPFTYVDPDGAQPSICGKTGGNHCSSQTFGGSAHGKGTLQIIGTKSRENFVADVRGMLKYLGSDATNAIDSVLSSGISLRIQHAPRVFLTQLARIDPSGIRYVRISLDPAIGLRLHRREIQSPAMGLYHELVHAERLAIGVAKHSRGVSTDSEERRVIRRERALAIKLGEPYRSEHRTGEEIEVRCPTCRDEN